MSEVSDTKVKDVERHKCAQEYLACLKVVDADTHITEWPDLWTSRAPARFKDRVPQVKEVNGKRAWFIDDHELAGDNGFAAIRPDGSKVPGLEFFDLGFNEVHPGAHDVKARLSYMDEEGIAAHIGYTNLLGFGGGKSMRVDAELRHVSMLIQNDAMAELQEASNNRIYPMAMIPWWDIDLAVAEAKRCADMGLRGINTHSSPHEHGLPDLGDRYWSPLWELCEDRGLPVNFHIGFSQGADGWMNPNVWQSQTDYEQYASSTAMLFAPNMQVIVNFLLSHVFERHPNLKFVSVESGLGWVPFMLEMLDYQVKENLPQIGEPVSETFRRHFFVCGWAEKGGIVDVVRRVGVDNVLFQTDFPHPTCLHPAPLAYHVETLSNLTPEERRKVFGANAEGLYDLDLSAA